MTQKNFTWLHITDLHVGQSSSGWLWPNFKSIFFADLQRLHDEVGGFDVVIFSGDLTQQGTTAEFTTLTGILEEMWDLFAKLGRIPVLFPAPGNHDLVRPAAENPTTLLIKQWHAVPAVRKGLWAEGKKNVYLSHIQTLFQNYTDWLKSEPISALLPKNSINGFIPGDISAKIEIGDCSVGLVGLNTAYLQLDGDDYEGKLNLDVRQLLPLTANAPDEWCSQNDVNFLITHHPSTWLSREAKAQYDTEIYPQADSLLTYSVICMKQAHRPIRKMGVLARGSYKADLYSGLSTTKMAIQPACTDTRRGLFQLTTALRNGSSGPE
jgi:hypothetical protein